MDTQTAILNADQPSKITQMVTLGLYSLGIGAGAVFGVAAILLAA